MLISVEHTLNYTYSDPVLLDPHTIYLSPQAYPHQRVIDFDLFVSPSPSKIVRNMTVGGNVQHIAYFNHSTSYLTIRASMLVRSDEFNVFDFVLFPFNTERIPFQYPDALKPFLMPYLQREGVTPTVEQFARQNASMSKWNTVDFLTHLCHYIYQSFVYEWREFGAPNAPEITLISRKGSCRDFAQLFIACCRSIGIAARFVSGYLYGNDLQAHELHAWAEAYLPGAGWRGFDPTEGKAVVNNHVYLATAANPLLIAPVAGTFRGKAESLLQTNIEIQEK